MGGVLEGQHGVSGFLQVNTTSHRNGVTTTKLTLSKIYMRITSRAIAIFLNYTDLQRTLYAFIAAETILLHLLQVAECLIAKNGVLIEGQV